MKEFIIKEKTKILIAVIILILILLGVGIGAALNQSSEVEVQPTEVVETTEEAEDNRITFLCLGVDKQVGMDERHPETNSIGQADVIMLVSIDKLKNQIDMITIPRDTMVTMKKYNHKMQFLCVEEDQICLQYAYADGIEKSCELTVDCVKSLFPDIEIDGYISINIEAFTQINDAIGGVEVTIDDPLIAHHMGVPAGTTMTLLGESSMLYLRIRDTEVEGSAYTRIDRMKEYIQKIIPKGVEVIREDPKVVSEIFGALEEHMITNVSVSEVIALLPELLDGTLEHVNMYTLEGEIRMGEDGCEEFYVDEKSLKEVELLFE